MYMKDTDFCVLSLCPLTLLKFYYLTQDWKNKILRLRNNIHIVECMRNIESHENLL